MTTQMPTQREDLLLRSAEKPPRLSIVVPVLNEALTLAQHLTALQSLRAHGVEVVVVDHQLDDEPALAAYWHCDRRSGHLCMRQRIQGHRWLSRTATDGRY